jgi:tyrosyl-DNA phosphodiesterase-1
MLNRSSRRNQSVWVQDLPMRSRPIQSDPKAGDFPSVMQQVLYAVNVAPALKTILPDHVNLL